jgi:hypothetical protein
MGICINDERPDMGNVFYVIFGGDYVAMILILGITFLISVIAVLSILNSWGRSI